MKDSGFLLYKCRQCGKIDKSVHTPDILVSTTFLMSGTKQPYNGVPVKMTGICHCDNDHIGVTDFIGAERDKECEQK